MSSTFGIISGAGPMAGALLYQQIIELLQARGAWQDSDFPAITIMNVPFSNMLDNTKQDGIVREELLRALGQLSLQVDYIYIACQTLHAFLTEAEIQQFGVVSLLELMKGEVASTSKPIWVAASNTSRRFNLHGELTSAEVQYLDPKKSDEAIKAVLGGCKPNLNWLIEKSFDNTIILGCTEFSVSCQGMKFQWIDPIHLAALDVVKKFIE